MSNRLFQGVIHQMKDAIDRVIGVVDENGVIISCSELVKIGEIRQGVRDELSYANDVITSGGYTYRPMTNGPKTDYIVFVEGEDKMAEKMSKLLAISLGNIKNLYDEKYDKGSFIKNIILDNILPSDIYIKSKELHFNTNESRVIFLIKFLGKTDMLPFEMLQNMFPEKAKDYVISVGEHDIVLVKDVKPGSENKDFEKIATNIADTLSAEFYTQVAIGISSVVENIKGNLCFFVSTCEVLDVFNNSGDTDGYLRVELGRKCIGNVGCNLFKFLVFGAGFNVLNQYDIVLAYADYIVLCLLGEHILQHFKGEHIGFAQELD